MQKISIITSILVVLVVSALGLQASENGTFTGTAARSGTYKRPLLDVDGKRYELKASDKADASVTEILTRFSQGDTGSYAVVGTRGTVNGRDGILVDSIASAGRPLPSAETTVTGTNTVQGNGPPAAAPTTPGVTSSAVTVGSDRYRVYNYDDLATRNYATVIPEGLKTVRGLLVNACYSGGDSRQDWMTCEYYRQFMHLHGFAYVGCTATAGSPGSVPTTDDTPAARHRSIFQAFEASMQVIATASRHPEMVNSPYVGVGFSAGGGFAFYLMVYAPDKTIAAVSYSAPYIFKRRLTSPPSPAVLNVPSICITGESEHFNTPFAPGVDPNTASGRIHEVFLPYRPKDAEYAWMERQGLGHEYAENRQDVLGMPLLDAAVRARYPKDADVTQGPIKLLPIDSSTGWIADNTTWKSGLTRICPAKDFKGDLGQSSWLLNEDIAFIYRAYATYDKPLTLTSPGNCWPTVPALDPGANVPIVVDDSKFPDWKQMAFYDGAKKLAEITQEPTRFTATSLTPGYHVFSVLATDGQGNVRTADPKMVVVRPTQDVPPVASKVTQQTMTGTVKKMDVEGRQLTMLAARELPFTVLDNTQIIQDGKPWNLTDIKVGDTVSVDYVRDGDTRTARKIRLLAASVSLNPEPAGRLAPGSSFTVTFPDMPPTFHALYTKQEVKTQMTVLLPRNYDPARKHPLLVYLNGGDGGNGDTLGVARGISGSQDFVCVSVPLFKADKPGTPGFGYIMVEPDGKYMWPFFKTMLDKAETLVPNLDKSHRVVGGFSNGAHAIAAMIDGSDGEICTRFSAFLLVEGGGRLKHYDWLKGKTVMMVSSNIKSRPRAQQILDTAIAAGAKGTFLCEDVGRHDFPVGAYKKVGAWLHGPALEQAKMTAQTMPHRLARRPAFADAVTVVCTLPAQVGTNFKSNIDLSGAVGLKHVVSFNGGGFVVYDKATGQVFDHLSQSEFWTCQRFSASPVD